jgi:DNA-binding transcriptional regulator LsrR (DeoR family)
MTLVHPGDEIDMLAAAYLAGGGHKQTEIAATLGLSQAAVSRLLARARKQYLREELRFLHENLDEKTMRGVVQRTIHRRLAANLDQFCARIRCRTPVLRVFASGSRETTVEAWQLRLETAARTAAPFVRDLLLRANLSGISWGQSVGNMAFAIRDLPAPPPRAGNPVRVVPLCGEPLGNRPTSLSSSSLSETLELALNGRVVSNLSLGMVPAFIPGGFSKTELKAVWKLIGLVKAYDEIFGGREPLVERLDMILTSIAPAERPLGYGGGDLLRTGGLKLEELRQVLLGDISGVCIPRPRLDRAGRQRLTRVNERWTGIRLAHLEACSGRASGNPLSGPPGVVVFAIGSNKARFAVEAIRLGLINHAFVDDDLAEEMDRLLTAELSR